MSFQQVTPHHAISCDTDISRLMEIMVSPGGLACMVMEAYFDESGCGNDESRDGKKDDLLAVAGYLFDPDKCRAFDLAWQSILKTPCPDDPNRELKYFRMSECAHGTGEFKGMPVQQRIDVEKRCIAAISEHAEIGVCVSMKKADFDFVSSPAYEKAFGGLYTHCALWCFNEISRWAERTNFNGSISYFFESGHKDQSEANEVMNRVATRPTWFNKFRYGGHAFKPKDQLRPLQSGDILAWQWHTDTKNMLDPNGRERRKDFIALREKPEVWGKHFSMQEILQTTLESVSRGRTY